MFGVRSSHHFRNRYLHTYALTFALGAFSTHGHAAGTLLLLEAPPAEPSWSGGLSIRGWPCAPGSSRERRAILPALDYESLSGLFAATDTGLGWNLAPELMSPTRQIAADTQR